MPNSAITPSPMNLSTPAAGLLDRAPHGAEIAVEHEHDVVGQLVLGHAGEGAQVGEQDRDLLLMALQIAGPRAGVAAGWRRAAAAARWRRRRWAASGRRAARWARRRRASSTLALGVATPAADARAPRQTRTRQVEQRPRPPHTEACGNAGDAARLEDGGAELHLDLLAVGIGDRTTARWLVIQRLTARPIRAAARQAKNPPMNQSRMA